MLSQWTGTIFEDILDYSWNSGMQSIFHICEVLPVSPSWKSAEFGPYFGGPKSGGGGGGVGGNKTEPWMHKVVDSLQSI